MRIVIRLWQNAIRSTTLKLINKNEKKNHLCCRKYKMKYNIIFILYIFIQILQMLINIQLHNKQIYTTNNQTRKTKEQNLLKFYKNNTIYDSI